MTALEYPRRAEGRERGPESYPELRDGQSAKNLIYTNAASLIYLLFAEATDGKGESSDSQ